MDIQTARSHHLRAPFVALMLALIVGSASQTLQAQAGAVKYEYYLTSARHDDPICVGDSLILDVRAERQLASDRQPNTNARVRMAGVTVTGSVPGGDYSGLIPSSLKTSTRANPPAAALFTFRAQAPGTTELRFTGHVGALPSLGTPPSPIPYREYAPLARNVTVVPCEDRQNSQSNQNNQNNQSNQNKQINQNKNATQFNRYKVTTVSTWNAGMEIVATIDDGIMSADAQGHFTGSANVSWRTSLIGSAGCGAGENRTPLSKAALTGEIDASDQLVVTITFEPRDFSGWATCGPASISTSNLATPAALTITVATSGGDSTLAHLVTAKNGSFAGSATIVVTPEKN